MIDDAMVGDPLYGARSHNWSSDAARFATRRACRCAKINTPTAKPIRYVQPDKKPNNTNGS